MDKSPIVGVVMGSDSDWPTMKQATDILAHFDIPFEQLVISAHRTPDDMANYGKTARNRGIKIIIAGAGGAAHLPGMIASLTSITVLGVPIETKTLKGIDSLLSIVQMPAGIPVPTLAIGKAGAINAALSAVSILANKYPDVAIKLKKFRAKQTSKVKKSPKNEK